MSANLPSITSSQRFRAMACGVEVVVVAGTDEHFDLARRTIAHLERCWTRFSPDSDISRINAAGGQAVLVDPSTITLITAMVQGWAATDGAFDPTLLAPLVGLGYASSWDDPDRVTSLAAGVALRTAPNAIEIDPVTGVVRAPAGIGLDPGGIGKGLAADLTVAALMAAGAAGALVSIGGDLRVSGMAPQDGGWSIRIADPVEDRIERGRLVLGDGGIATSGTAQRAWLDASGHTVHHLLDPATGRPVSSGPQAIVEATVVAGSAAWAEVWTKAVLVRGATSTLPRLDALGLAGRAVFADGTMRVNECWQRFAVETGTVSSQGPVTREASA